MIDDKFFNLDMVKQEQKDIIHFRDLMYNIQLDQVVGDWNFVSWMVHNE